MAAGPGLQQSDRRGGHEAVFVGLAADEEHVLHGLLPPVPLMVSIIQA